MSGAGWQRMPVWAGRAVRWTRAIGPIAAVLCLMATACGGPRQAGTIDDGQSQGLTPTLVSNARATPEGYPLTPMVQLETGMHTDIIKRIDVDAAGRILVSGSDDKTVRVWDLRTGDLRRTIRVPAAPGATGRVHRAGGRIDRTAAGGTPTTSAPPRRGAAGRTRRQRRRLERATTAGVRPQPRVAVTDRGGGGVG